MTTAIGFIGLGRMGFPMAMNLKRAGFRVLGFDTDPAVVSKFTEAGGEGGGTAEEIAGGADMLVTMLPTGAIVRAVLLDNPGFARALKPGAIVVDMSSSSPTNTRSLSADLAAMRLPLVDAPVSGGVAKAEDGSLAILVGGEQPAIAKAMPALEAMGHSIVLTGAVGTAHCMKALNNFVSAAGLVAVSEALHVGRRFGLEPATIVEALNASTGRNNTTERKALPYMVPENFVSGFALSLMAKDIGIAADLARTLEVHVPELTLMEQLWKEASASLGPDADHTAIHSFIGSSPYSIET